MQQTHLLGLLWGLRRRLSQVWSALIDLKHGEPAFRSSDYSLNAGNEAKRIEINHEDMDVRIIRNFVVEALAVNPSFSTSGTWYSYFTGDRSRLTFLSFPPDCTF